MIRDILRRITPAPLVELRRTIKTRVRASPKQSAPSSPKTLDCLIAYNRLGGYCIPRSSLHRPAAQTVLAGKIYEPETIAYLTSHFGGGDIVHAGTYFGDFLPALSSACPAGSKIWAFEPNPENFRCASITMLINRLENVDLTNAGLGAKSGTAPRLWVAAAVCQALAIPMDGQTEPVRIVAIDDAVPADRKVSMIQLDVEYYEQEALTGALETIKRWRPVLVLESVPEATWFSNAILSLGYVATGTAGPNAVYACK